MRHVLAAMQCSVALRCRVPVHVSVSRRPHCTALHRAVPCRAAPHLARAALRAAGPGPSPSYSRSASHVLQPVP